MKYLSSERPAPQCEDNEASNKRARMTKKLLEEQVIIRHRKFVASTNPPNPALIEKIRKRVGESGISSSSNPSSDTQAPNRQKSERIRTHDADGEDEQQRVQRRKVAIENPTEPKMTRRRFTDAMRLQVLDDQVMAKKRRLNEVSPALIQRNVKKQLRRDKVGVHGSVNEHRLDGDNSSCSKRCRISESNAIARSLNVGRK